MATDKQTPPVFQRPTAKEICDLLNTASLAEVPMKVCELMQGYASVIWKPARSMSDFSSTDSEQCEGRLYPYSSNFTATADIQHAGIPLEISKDTTGRFYASGHLSHFENDFPSVDQSSLSHQFMADRHLKKVCLARFDMRDGGGGDFVVSVYRRDVHADFCKDDAKRLEELAGFLPIVYQRLVASQLRRAIVKVNEILRPRCDDLTKAYLPLTNLCNEIASFFRFHEVSIFMNDGITEYDTYHLVASTLDKTHIKNSYRANKEDGVTGYVLAIGELIWFHDLHNIHHVERGKLIQHRYPGIQWADGADFGKLAKNMYNLKNNSLAPPLPFMALPVSGETGKTLGILRASLGMNPFFFLNSQIQTFGIIAAELGRWWESILHGVEQKRRADVWEALDKTISAQHNMLKGSDDINRLAEQTVQSIADQPGFDIVAFRRGKEANDLRLAAFGTSKREKARTNQRSGTVLNSHIPLNSFLEKPPQNRGFFVGKIERSAIQILEQGSESEQLLFDGMSQVLSCPVIIKSKLYGVLDVGFRDERDYAPAKERIHQFLELVARQLALFERVAESIEEVESAQDNELKTYAVVTHQLKTPLFTASRRLRGLTNVTPESWNEKRAKILQQVAGMVRKARAVTNSIEAIGKSVSGQIIRVKCNGVRSEVAWKLCLEVAQNTLTLTDERMHLAFKLEPDHWHNEYVQWNIEYAEQCLDAVINNAFKYSDVGRSVRIVGQSEGKHYVIKVINRGSYLIKSEDIDNCKKREWRGDKAKERDGAGIGLWITDCFMLAQGGELRIHPTTSTGDTQIELRFLSRM